MFFQKPIKKNNGQYKLLIYSLMIISFFILGILYFTNLIIPNLFSASYENIMRTDNVGGLNTTNQVMSSMGQTQQPSPSPPPGEESWTPSPSPIPAASIIPDFEFVQISQNQKIQGRINIQGKVAGAGKVEFYLIPISSTIEFYLGSAVKTLEQLWVYEWDTTQTPNNQYYLTSKIYTLDGSAYQSSQQILIEVLNPVPAPSTESQQITEEMMTKQENINKEAEQQKQQVINKTVNEISQETQINSEIIDGNIKELGEKITQISNREIEISQMQKINAPATEISTAQQNLQVLNQEKEAVKQIAVNELSQKVELQNQKQAEDKISRSLDSLEKNLAEIEAQKKQQIELLYGKDSDSDELLDVEEIRLGTDPKIADSDGDGYLDGDEIKNGYNPLVPSRGDKNDKIIFENPKKTGIEKADVYQITKVERIDLPNGQLGVKLAGQAPPFSFVTLFIYSQEPIIVTVKTDGNGNWEYVLDKPLDDGEHEIYVTVTDNVGKITAKSVPAQFIKTAQAITFLDAQARAAATPVSAPIEKAKKNYALIGLIITALAIIAAIVIVGLIASRRSKENIQ